MIYFDATNDDEAGIETNLTYHMMNDTLGDTLISEVYNFTSQMYDFSVRSRSEREVLYST
jgi:hypothetical protein